METRRIIIALLLGFAVFAGYRFVYDQVVPVPEPPADIPVTTAPRPAPAPATDTPTPTSAPQAPLAAQSAPSGSDLGFSDAAEEHRIRFGGGADDKLTVDLTSRGAAIERILLSERKGETYVHRLDELTHEPYLLIRPIEDPGGGRAHVSYLTPKIVWDQHEYPVDELQWELAGANEYEATFSSTLRDLATGEGRLRVIKTYTLEPGTARLELHLRFENLGVQPLDVQVQQNGPIGILKENMQWDMRRLVKARRAEAEVEPKAYARSDLAKAPSLGSSAEQFMWCSLQNKYFAVFTRPLPTPGTNMADYIQHVAGDVALPGSPDPDSGDYLARFLTVPKKLDAGASVEYVFEIYAGTKSENDLESADAAYADRTRIGYVAARDADQRCCCTFSTLTSFMTSFLEGIYAIVGNYGVAIIILVLIIRALLHPLAVFQQTSMYNMQEAQLRLKPKLDAIKANNPNDKVKVNQETMKLYSDEGVNPMASMVGMLPMMIQMPILIALWTALNTDVHLRHAGFDPWWITDLSAPDRLIEFAGDGLTIPVLSWLPFIGKMFTDIPSLNLLPLLMGVSMWLQQKYMPKPGMDLKKEAAKKAAAENKLQKSSGMSPEDQARQQQMMMYMMSIIFPLMFYMWPSGLNLYWMATNVFGIAESVRIRRQIKRKKEQRELLGPQPVKKKKTGPFGRLMKRMAEQADTLQKKADALSLEEKKQSDKKNHK